MTYLATTNFMASAKERIAGSIKKQFGELLGDDLLNTMVASEIEKYIKVTLQLEIQTQCVDIFKAAIKAALVEKLHVDYCYTFSPEGTMQLDGKIKDDIASEFVKEATPLFVDKIMGIATRQFFNDISNNIRNQRY